MNREVLNDDILYFVNDFPYWKLLYGKTVLITGCTGLLGSIMTKCLLALNKHYDLGIKILGVVRNISKAESILGRDDECLSLNELELSEISSERIKDNVDYVIHLASPTASKYFIDHPVETLQTAIEGTNAVLNFSAEKKIEKMLYISSLEVYGRNEGEQWISEDFQGFVNPLEVRSSYNMGKRAAESLCSAYFSEYNVPVSIVRLTQTFGAGVEYNDNRVFAQFARKIIENEDIELHTLGETSRMYCYTIDAITAMLLVLLKGQSGEAYNVANKSTYISIKDMAYMLRDYFNPNINVIISLKDNQGYAPQTRLRLNTDKIENLGWSPKYSLPVMFGRLIRYMS
ncbi:MAG: NAD-dependent epimerase/dehydratase family protein [Bacteroidaceae bacterium]|nr:NAD-dependent epimerase/dehydratase family protein [Bacteroidaceae bacterium]